MTKAPAVATLIAALGLAAPALAAPFGGAALVGGPAQTLPLRGFRLSTPQQIADGGSVRIHGSVCRTSRGPMSAPRGVLVEEIGADGRVVGSAKARLTGNLSGRPGLGCAYYDLQPGWTEGSAIRVSALSN